jgi:hypothetical protein
MCRKKIRVALCVVRGINGTRPTQRRKRLFERLEFAAILGAEGRSGSGKVVPRYYFNTKVFESRLRILNFNVVKNINGSNEGICSIGQ